MSQSSSCSGDASPPMQLTPRTKIQRMLQAIDDADSDKENAGNKQSPTRVKSSTVNTYSRARKSPAKETNARSRVPSDSGSTEDERPLSRSSKNSESFKTRQTDSALSLATDTASGKADDAEANASPGEEDAAGAYARVRKQLMGGHKPSEKVMQRSKESSPVVQTQESAAVVAPRSSSPSPRRSQQSRHSFLGLSLSPTRSSGNNNESSESEHDNVQSESRNRLQELVARKRREREEKEKAARHSSDVDQQSDASDSIPTSRKEKSAAASRNASENEGSDPAEAAKKTRPSRKASKKAMEEMARETQRMSRNMQLSHQLKTKKKFTTADLFKKMGFRQPKQTETESAQSSAGSSSPAKPQSDRELPSHMETPPSSPPSLGGSSAKRANHTASHDPAGDSRAREEAAVDDLPTLDELISSSPVEPLGDTAAKVSRQSDGPTQKPNKPSLKKFLKSAKRPSKSVSDDDDDLEIVQPRKPSRISALDQAEGKKGSESRSMLTLRALAHVNDHNHDRRLKGTLERSELNSLLTRRAREQAQTEKMEKIQALKDKGIYIETEEEKERNQMQIESMIDRARREADELAKREKEAAKREGREVENDGLDSDEDEDFAPSEEGEDAEEGDVQFSGSEDEEHENAEDEGSEEDEGDEADDEDEEMEEGKGHSDRPKNLLVDDAAKEDSDGNDEDELSDGFDIGRQNELQTPKPITKRKRLVVADDEDDDEDEELPPITPAPQMAKTPGSKSSLVQAFGFDQHKSPAGGLSQFFGGTMAQSQTQTQGNDDAPGSNSQDDSLAFLRGQGPVLVPPFSDALEEPTQDYVVQDSQTAQPSPAKSSPANAAFNISSETARHSSATQESPMFEATQDMGFAKGFSPMVGGYQQNRPDPDNALEMTMSEQPESPIVERKGRLKRGRRESAVEVEASDQDVIEASSIVNEAETDEDAPNAFSHMQKAAKRKEALEAFDKKTSNAKNMFEEQAEESEDEYNGVGGVSDDDSDDEMDEELKKMMDDSTVKVNKGKAAEFHAEWERAQDEKNTTKLYRDITTGALRRQRDGAGDLLEWDDEDEAAARRRAAKQRQEAQMRKALLSDGKLEKIAENPKRQAFFNAITDYAGDDETSFLDEGDTPSQSQSMEFQDLTSTRKRGRNEDEEEESDKQAMPPPKSRRTNASRPQSALDIRRTLSKLLDEPDENGEPDIITDSQPDEIRGAYSAPRPRSPNAESDKENDSDSDLELEDAPEEEPDSTPLKARETSPPRHRRTPADPAQRAVIDRIALKRASSTSTNQANASTGNRMAFAAPGASNGSFKIPSLLRRATTNASMSSTEGSLAEKSAAAGITARKDSGGTRMGGSKKSSINWAARDMERQEKLQKLEKERVAERTRVAGRVGAKRGSLSGGFGGGGFE